MTILSALASLYDRMADAGEAPRRGYSTEKIGAEVVIDRDGALVAINPKLVPDGKRMVAAQIAVPAAVKRSSGIAPNFLWDKTAYVLGVTAQKDDKGKPVLVDGQPVPGQERRTADEHAAFVTLHRERLTGTRDEGLLALLTFLDRWTWEDFAARGCPPEVLDQNIVFRLDGESRYLHDRPTTTALLAGGATKSGGLCLVTGARAPAARLHPSIKGVMDAQSSGASLVSFNKTSFESHGKKQGDNAPVSEAAAFAYGTALNALLARSGAGPTRRALRIGDTTVVFWAETSERKSDEDTEDLMAGLLDPPEGAGESEADAAQKLRLTLEALARGQAPDDPRFHPDTRVYVLGLAPNAARLSVRFWLPGTLGDFTRNVLRFHEDLRLEPPAWKRTPSVRTVARETARIYVGANDRKQYDEATIPPRLTGDLMRSIAGKQPFPQTLLSGVIGRLRTDGEITPGRAAICKAFLKRNIDERKNRMSLDKDSGDIAYVLGRLFGAYTYAEQSFAKRNATIRDRYLAGASANPAGIFPLLMRGYEHNRSGLLKSDGPKHGAGIKADRAVSEILDKIKGSGGFPASLKMEEQALFFIGFYHQFNSFFATPEVAVEHTATDDEQEEN